MIAKALIQVSAILIIFGCGKKKSEPASTEPASASGSLAIMNVGEASLKSALSVTGAKGSLEGGSAGTLVISALTMTDPCSQSSGEPIHVTDSSKNDSTYGSMKHDVIEYPGSKFWCMMNANTYNFTTVQGAGALPKMFICAGGENLKPNAGPLRVDLKSDSTCVVDLEFKQLIDAPESEGGMGGTMSFNIMIVQPSARAADGWDYDLYAGDLGDGSQAKMDAAMVRMSFKSSAAESGFMFHTAEPNGSGVGGDTYQVMYKLGSAGELRFETRRQFVECSDTTTCTAGPRRYTRHVRALVKGSIGTDGVFSTLTSMQGIDTAFDWDAGSGNTASTVSGNPIHATISTINGNATSGFLTTGFANSAPVAYPATLSALQATSAIGTTCYGGDKTCSGVKALKPA